MSNYKKAYGGGYRASRAGTSSQSNPYKGYKNFVARLGWAVGFVDGSIKG
jgi:hypothetical protein